MWKKKQYKYSFKSNLSNAAMISLLVILLQDVLFNYQGLYSEQTILWISGTNLIHKTYKNFKFLTSVVICRTSFFGSLFLSLSFRSIPNKPIFPPFPFAHIHENFKGKIQAKALDYPDSTKLIFDFFSSDRI